MILSLCTLLFALLPAPAALAQGRADYLGEPVRYEDAARTDPVARLAAAVASGERKLEWDAQRGWLPAVLEALEAPVSSQVLVFSKTSFQDTLISPTRPRAIYYGQDVYLGWIPGAPIMELTAIDPVQGPTFYALRQQADRLEFERRDEECLRCHATSRTRHWPGNLVRSVHSDAEGFPILRSGTHMTTQSSPLEERWGGWYVSGTHGEQRHMGNTWVGEGESERVDVEAGANVTDLSGFFETEQFLSPHSDLVALMVMEHQTQMHNLLARASYKGRIALAYQAEMNQLLGEPAGTVSDSTRRRFERAAQDVVDHLLFQDEAPLSAPIAGSSSFAADYAAAGRRDSQGRSLRDLDLERRLFRFPCSDLVYSDAFDALPAPVLEAIWSELLEILNGRDVDRDFSHLSPADRSAILEILRETKQGLPASWGS